MKKEILYTAVIGVALSSCGIYNKYERPEVQTEGLYRTEEATRDSSSIATLKWKELFTDSDLQKLIEEGIRSNTDLEVARLKVKEARATLTDSKLNYLPSLQLDGEGTLKSYNRQKATKSYDIGVSASWEIDFFGKLTNAKRQAYAALKESDTYRQAVQTQLIATIAANYYSLLMLDEQVSITAATAESWREYVRTLRSLMKAGQANRTDISQAEASRLSAETALQDLQQQTRELENTLSTLLGRVPGAIERGKLDRQTFPRDLSVGVPLSLLSTRPDVRSAEASLEQAFYATHSARSAFYPSVTLSGSAGWTNNGGSGITNPGAWLLQAVGSLVQPLFNRGANVANLKIAKAQQEEALLTYRQTLLDAGSEVNNALTQWQTAGKKMELEKEQIAQLQLTVHDTQLLMQHGTANYLEILVARQSLLSAQLNLVADRYAEIEGVINLYHALGGGAEE